MLDARRDSVQVGVGLCERDARLQLAPHHHPVIVARSLARIRETRQKMHLVVPSGDHGIDQQTELIFCTAPVFIGIDDTKLWFAAAQPRYPIEGQRPPLAGAPGGATSAN